MQNNTKHIRSAPKLHLMDAQIDSFVASMTPLMGMQVANFLGDAHVRREESIWYGEAYDDGLGFVVPFKLVMEPDGNCYANCAEGDVEFIANAMANDVWNEGMRADNFITAVPVY